MAVTVSMGLLFRIDAAIAAVAGATGSGPVPLPFAWTAVGSPGSALKHSPNSHESTPAGGASSMLRRIVAAGYLLMGRWFRRNAPYLAHPDMASHILSAVQAIVPRPLILHLAST